jgi:NAD(P)-dependent dehydrogenase (short-subunit alcohol dehydrogenase family)
MAGRLEGKVAVITGAGSGIGAATAEVFVREGARVVAADISGQQEDVAKRLGDGCLAVHADVSKGDDVQAMLAAATSHFGRLDLVYNNAGIDGATAPTGEMSEEDFDRVWAVNGRGVFLGMRYAIPLLLENGGGSIINTASVASMVAFPSMPAYCAAKGAVVMLTKTAAAEYGRAGIRVNAICPGVIDTAMTKGLSPELIAGVKQMTPMGRIADASEVADVALFLASDESSFITGAAVLVDGGYITL